MAPPLHITQQHCLASMAAWFSSTGTCHHDLLLHMTWGYIPAVNSRPHPGIAPQSLCSSSQLLCLLWDPRLSLGYVWLWQGSSESDQLLHSQPQRCLLCLPKLPQCGDWTPASVPSPIKGRVSPTNSPLFLPTFFVLLSFAWFYIFFSSGQILLPLSVAVLLTLLCLKVYSWYMCGERCTPCSPTPLPTILFSSIHFKYLF